MIVLESLIRVCARRAAPIACVNWIGEKTMRIHINKLFGVLAFVTAMAVGINASAADQTMTPLDIPMISDMETLVIGEDAPPFNVKDLDGVPYAFEPTSPGAKMVLFWSIFCEPCRAEMPLVQSMYEKYKDAGFEVVSVALDGDLAKNIKEFAKHGGYTFTILLDEESEDGSLVVAEEFMVPGTPTIYLVNEQGKITYTRVGRVGEAELEKEILKAMGK